MCRLKSKFIIPEFQNLIKIYDIVILAESKTDALDILDLPDGYLYHAKHRTVCNKRSGGIVVVYKTSLNIC